MATQNKSSIPEVREDATYNLFLPLEWKRVDFDHFRAAVFNPVTGEFIFYGKVRVDYGPTRGGVVLYYRRLASPNEPVRDYDYDHKLRWRKCDSTGPFREGEDHVMVEAEGKRIKELLHERDILTGRRRLEPCHLGFCVAGMFDEPKFKTATRRWH